MLTQKVEGQNLRIAPIVQEESSSNSSISNSTPPWKFHIFLSFRGEDTRTGFTDHLYAALKRKGFTAFRDHEELGRGIVISHKLLKAIEESLSAIVVLSQNYASSSWCLDELQKILDSRNELGQEVFPIFYGVDPYDVRHQKGSFAQSFTKHEAKFKEDQEKVRKWRDSLTEVSNLSGWDSKGWHETKLIENVVEALWIKLRYRLPSYYKPLVGIDSRIGEIYLWLEIELDDVRFVGIWGMGGIGKTTLARVVYERFGSKFEICCFLENVREVSERDGLVRLQRKLLSHLEIRNLYIEDPYAGKKTIRNLFRNKNVLLILDDVSSIDQLQNLAGAKDWFGAGSRIIVTTRDKHLLIAHEVRMIYEVELMNYEESLQLLSRKAFKRDKPKEDYLELSISMVEYVRGLPLALEVLGSFLCGRSVPQWEDTLKKLKQVPNHNIFKILKISFDGLEETEKTIFLDIACFFNGWDKDKVIQILKSCGLYPTIGISVLVEKSLLSDCKMHIKMHDLLQEMGMSIVCQESPNDASKRSRLWSMEDVDQVLRKNMENEAIRGMILCNSYEVPWDLEAFSKMCNLRLLIISSDLHLPCGLKCLSSALKVLDWQCCPLKSLPLGTQLDRLVYLKMHHSKIKQLLNGTQCLKKLKILDLSNSKYLIKTPKLFEVPNLEILILEGCINLVEFHPSLRQHKKLLVVNLKDCKNLKDLPSKLEMNSLKEFVLCGCTKVKKISEFGENMKNLVTIDLEETAIVKLPTSLGFLNGLEVLNLRGCKNLVCLPHTINNLKHLRILNISGCSKFSKIPENLNENEALEVLDVSGTDIRELPSSTGHLEKLKTLSCYGCKGSPSVSWFSSLPFFWRFQRHPFPMGLIVPPSIFALKSLTKLDLSFCNIGDGLIPDDLGCLSSLRKLNLEGNNFVNLPAGCISNLLQLNYIHLNFCPRLQSLPNPSPSLFLMEAIDCTSMKTASDEQLWYLFASHNLNEPGRFVILEIPLGGVWNRGVRDKPRAWLIDSFIATILGSEIPSWFDQYQSYFYIPSNKLLGMYTMDIPPASEWAGIAICLLLDDDMFYSTETKQRYSSPNFHINIETFENGKWKLGNLSLVMAVDTKIKFPHLWIQFVQLSKKYWRLDYLNIRFQFSFSPGYVKDHREWGLSSEKEQKDGVNQGVDRKILKYGVRELRKEELEEWANKMSESHLLLEEHKEGVNQGVGEADSSNREQRIGGFSGKDGGKVKEGTVTTAKSSNKRPLDDSETTVNKRFHSSIR